MNDDEMKNLEFIEALMKRASGNETKEEEEKLDQLLISGKISDEEIEKANKEVQSMLTLLPLMDADEEAEFPEYARERLQTKVKETLGRPEKSKNSNFSFFKLLLPVAGAAILIISLIPNSQANLNFQYATWDPIGTVRGANENEANKFFPSEINQTVFDDLPKLEEWKEASETQENDTNTKVRIVHDVVMNNLSVSFKINSKLIEKTIPIDGTFDATIKKIEEIVLKELKKAK